MSMRPPLVTELRVKAQVSSPSVTRSMLWSACSGWLRASRKGQDGRGEGGAGYLPYDVLQRRRVVKQRAVALAFCAQTLQQAPPEHIASANLASSGRWSGPARSGMSAYRRPPCCRRTKTPAQAQHMTNEDSERTGHCSRVADLQPGRALQQRVPVRRLQGAAATCCAVLRTIGCRYSSDPAACGGGGGSGLVAQADCVRGRGEPVALAGEAHELQHLTERRGSSVRHEWRRDRCKLQERETSFALLEIWAGCAGAGRGWQWEGGVRRQRIVMGAAAAAEAAAAAAKT